MAAYLAGDTFLALFIAVLVACAVGVASSVVFTRTAGRSAFWNIGLAVALVLAAAGSLLLALVLVLL